MKITVLGAGIVGVTAAWELMRDGHEVTVVERQAGPALGTSFANAGLIAPSHSFSWASPKAPKILLKSLYLPGQALRFRPSLDPHLWTWSARFLRNCTAERAVRNTRRKLRLARYSSERLHAIATDAGIAFHGVPGGLVYLYRTPETLARGAANMAILREEGMDLRVIDADAVIALDPALAPARERIAGAVWCPDDGSGDARVYTTALATRCAEEGVVFRYGTQATGLRREGDRIAAVKTTTGEIAGDLVVLSLGVWSPALVRGLGLSLPVYPIKGYSVTMPIGPQHRPPAYGGVDEDNLVAYARFGDRMRVTATAEFAGFDTGHRPADFSHMLARVRELYPEGADYDRPDYWAGLRPMTPEGTPIIGHTLGNLIVNTGHGHMGWTMAPGSARIVADMVKGAQPAVPLDGMGLR
jgi:D-amino-acid dehydrogenase